MFSGCQVLPYNPVVLIPVHNVIFCAKKKKIGIFKKNKHMWSSILLPPAHKIFTKKKNYCKVDQKLWNETWPHTFCAGKKIHRRPESLGNINQIK